ncbi:MAG: ParB/RepB/Spo0J family partition protein [Candidatus Campbellbacteria bacterium]|nr:ParB/RepB/Spo0J family partition protein [Candidatus Campbellbacteria bacterium]
MMVPEEKNAIYWIEVDKIVPNPYQPRTEFNDEKINILSESIRQYGVLQPIVVTKKEVPREDGGFDVSYELIAGERRLRASKLAGLNNIPAIIRMGSHTEKLKLELAIVENLQREDLSPVDRAKAFRQLAEEFGLTHNAIAERVGKSREYISNSLRLLLLPEDMLNAMMANDINEGHARPLLMLQGRGIEQQHLFQEIMKKKLTVRVAEKLARRILSPTQNMARRGVSLDIQNYERRLTDMLGTRVHIETADGSDGKIMIDFFSRDDLDEIAHKLSTETLTTQENEEPEGSEGGNENNNENENENKSENENREEKKGSDDEDLYSIKNFSI